MKLMRTSDYLNLTYVNT